MRHKSGWLSRVLERLDPAAADRIHANDTPKLIRAIEVSLEARRPITEAWTAGAEPLTGYRILRIGLAPERAALYDRIDATRGGHVRARPGGGDGAPDGASTAATNASSMLSGTGRRDSFWPAS